MTTRKKILLAVALTALGGISTWLLSPKYYLAETGGAQLVCNSRECYLFLNQGSEGWKANGIRLLGNYLVALLGGANPPTNMSQHTTVLVIRDHSVERRSFPGSMAPDAIYKGSLYVHHLSRLDPRDSRNGPDGRPRDYSFGRWTAGGLEVLSPAQKKEVDTATDRLGPERWDSSPLWRGSPDKWLWIYPPPPGELVRIDLEDGPLTFSTRGDSMFLKAESIVLRTSDGREQTLWTIDRRPRRATPQDYARVFPPGS